MACIGQGEGDIVTAEAMPDLPAGEVVIRSISGDDGRLPLIAVDNCVGIAALETLKALGQTACGVAITLDKVSLHANKLRCNVRTSELMKLHSFLSCLTQPAQMEEPSTAHKNTWLL